MTRNSNITGQGDSTRHSRYIRPRALLNLGHSLSQYGPRPVNNIFIFSYWDLKVKGKFYFSLQPTCVEVAHVQVDEARDR